MAKSDELAERAYKRIIASTTRPEDVANIIEEDVESASSDIVGDVRKRTKEKLIFAEQTSKKHNTNVKKALDILNRK